MSYDLTIQFDEEATASIDLVPVELFLQSCPGMRRFAWNRWIYEPNSSVHVEIDLVSQDDNDPNKITSIGVGVPYPFLPTSGEPALLLCFRLAERLRWRVFDEQLGAFISRGDMRELLTRQSEFAHQADKNLVDNHASAVATWFDNWTSAAKQQSLLFLVVAVVLAGAAAIVIMLQLDVQEDRMATSLFLVGLPIALLIFTIKVALDAWLEKRRQDRKQRS